MPRPKPIRRVGKKKPEYVKIEDMKNMLSNLFDLEYTPDSSGESKRRRFQHVPRTWPRCNEWVVEISKHLKAASDIILSKNRNLAVKTYPLFKNIMEIISDPKITKREIKEERAAVLIEGLKAGLSKTNIIDAVNEKCPEIKKEDIGIRKVFVIKKRPKLRKNAKSKIEKAITCSEEETKFTPKKVKSNHFFEKVDVPVKIEKSKKTRKRGK